MRLALLLTLLAAGCARAEPVRFATFNSALSREAPGELLAAMRTRDDERAKAVAAVIQAARPDVLVLQEFDHDGRDDEALQLFQQNYLAIAQSEGLEPIAYEHAYLPPSNTGVPTGVDLNGDGLVAPCPGAEVGTDAYAADCHGWGKFPGQYAFVVLSKHPIDRENIRTFQEFLWKDLPDNHLPDDYYSEAAKAVLRLSSKNHVDVPVRVGDETIHVLAAHPTPPVFDGPEDRNGRRNHDEINLLIREMPALSRFVVLGDLNADRWDGERYDPPDLAVGPEGTRELRPADAPKEPDVINPSPMLGGRDRPREGEAHVERPPAIEMVLRSPKILSNLVLTGYGNADAAERQGGANERHAGHAKADTADWDDDRGPGNLRVDYALPSRDLPFLGGGVLWPRAGTLMMGVDLPTVERASDHRLVWVDVDVD